MKNKKVKEKKTCKECKKKEVDLKDYEAKYILHYGTIRNFKKENTCLLVYLGVVILLLFGTNLINFQYDKLVDEDGFCLDKLREVFPDYNFESAYYNIDPDACVGKYNNTTIIEEFGGFKELIISEVLTKNFEIIDMQAIAYLDSDNNTRYWLIIGIVLCAVAIIILFIYFLVMKNDG